jgi:hypothetical protein
VSEDPNLYPPSQAALDGARVNDLVRRALRLHEHLWVATAMWTVVDPGRPQTLILDQENLLVSPRVGCYICEESWSRRLAQRRCTGEGRPGPAPLLTGDPRG